MGAKQLEVRQYSADVTFRDRCAGASRSGILNSMVFDWMARRILGGLHLNKSYLAALAWPRMSKLTVEQLPGVPPPPATGTLNSVSPISPVAVPKKNAESAPMK
jgi:hypothetical protein